MSKRVKYCFLLVQTLVLIASTCLLPAQAKLLNGHIEQIKEVDLDSNSNSNKSQANTSFPEEYIGLWRCQTSVIDSQVETVSKGTTLSCDIQFVPDKQGKVSGQWIQPGWVETQISTLSWNPKEAKVDRTSYYFGQSMVQGGSWACRSRDHFIQIAQNRMECQSYIDQYLDGKYLGRYRTQSILTRIENQNNAVITTSSAL